MKRMLASPRAPSLRAALDPKLVLSLAAVYVIWSSTYLAMKIAIHELPPLLMASLRFAAAGLVMLVIALRRGAPWPAARDWLGSRRSGRSCFSEAMASSGSRSSRCHRVERPSSRR